MAQEEPLEIQCHYLVLEWDQVQVMAQWQDTAMVGVLAGEIHTFSAGQAMAMVLAQDTAIQNLVMAEVTREVMRHDRSYGKDKKWCLCNLNR